MLSASARTWFIRYTFYGNLHFLSRVIIFKIKINVILSEAWLTLTIFFSFLAIMFSPLAFFLSNPITHLMFKYLGLERDW